MSIRKREFSEEDVKFIYKLLRQGSTKWSGRAECLRLARKKVLIGRSKNGKAKYKFQWQCASCKQWHKNEASMEVDHIVEIGGVGGYKGDMHAFVDSILPRPIVGRLQCLCRFCHARKTRNYMAASSQWERKRR